MYHINVAKGNVVNASVEAIVTPANNNLMPGQGISKMVFYSAGENMLKACAQLKYCDTGCTVVTSGYNIPAEFIIHAVGPYWHGGYVGEAEDLASTYISIMRDVRKLKIKSIAIPAICTGLGGYPGEEAADIAVSSVISYLQSHNMDTEVWFMCYDIDTMYDYREKVNKGVPDISKYFGRKEINVNAKMNDAELKLLKKKLFKKTVEKEKEEEAVKSVIKRVIKKKYSDCTVLLSKKNDTISMKTVEKFQKSGPFITSDSLIEYSYKDGKMKLKLQPFCFTETPQELESKKEYEQDKNQNGIPDKFEHKQNEQSKSVNVTNVEDILQNAAENAGNKEEVKRVISAMDSMTRMKEIKEEQKAKEKLNAENENKNKNIEIEPTYNAEPEYDWEPSTTIGEQLSKEENEQMDYMYDVLSKEESKEKQKLNPMLRNNKAESQNAKPNNHKQYTPSQMMNSVRNPNSQDKQTPEIEMDVASFSPIGEPQYVYTGTITQQDIDEALNGIAFNDDEHYGEPLDQYPIRRVRKRNKSKKKYWPNFKPDYHTREYQKQFHQKKDAKNLMQNN